MLQDHDAVSALSRSHDPYRLAILLSHPIQYFTPLFRRLAQEPEIDLTVYFCSRQGIDPYEDEGFGRSVQWDVPLLEGYKHRFLPNLWKKDRVAGFFSLVNPRLVQALRTEHYDAILVHGHLYFSYLLAIALANALRIPVFMRADTHLGLRRSKLKRALRAPLLRLFYNHLCDRCLPIGSLNRDFYRAYGVPPERLFDVPFAVDNAYFSRAAAPYRVCVDETRAALRLPVDKPVLLYSSKLIAGKRPMDLLMAYHRMCTEGIRAALVFVGSGELEPSLRGFADGHNLSDVYFLGFRNQSELPMLYAISDLFVLPSENEAWGLVINEAMCAGLPIIASEEIGAVPDLVIQGYNGLTYRAGDVDQLSAHLESLITNKSLRQQMGENSLAQIKDWNLERCVEGISAALHSLGRAEGDRR
jgi:glycosyltransferase involved in cell wall biosynthesis